MYLSGRVLVIPVLGGPMPFSSPDLVPKFIEEFDASKLASDSCCDGPGFLATALGAASTLLGDRCGQCTSWQTAGGPGGIQTLCMVRREWLLLVPQAFGEEKGAGCWVIAGTWPLPDGSCSPSSTALRVSTPSPSIQCGVPLRQWHCARAPVRFYACAWVLLRLWLCA